MSEPAEVVRIVRGVYGYAAGIFGTVNVPAGAAVKTISAGAPNAGEASIQIDGGDIITIPSGEAYWTEVEGTLIAPTIVFTGTSTFIVEWYT